MTCTHELPKFPEKTFIYKLRNKYEKVVCQVEAENDRDATNKMEELGIVIWGKSGTWSWDQGRQLYRILNPDFVKANIDHYGEKAYETYRDKFEEYSNIFLNDISNADSLLKTRSEEH